MFKVAVSAAVLVASSLAVAASTLNVSIEMQNVERDRDVISAVFKMDSRADYNMVVVECAFLGGDKRALDVGVKPISNVTIGSERYGKVSIVRKADDIVSAKCYVDTYS